MIVNRLKEYIDFQKIKVSTFEKEIGMSNNSFRKSLNTGGAIGSDKLEKILKKYNDINPIWLLTGKGEMLIIEDREELKGENDKTVLILKEMLSDKDKEIGKLREDTGALHNELQHYKSRLTELEANSNKPNDIPEQFPLLKKAEEEAKYKKK